MDVNLTSLLFQRSNKPLRADTCIHKKSFIAGRRSLVSPQLFQGDTFSRCSHFHTRYHDFVTREHEYNTMTVFTAVIILIPIFQYARLPKKSQFRFITPGDLGLIISTIS